MAKIKVVIADDHAILRAGLRALINAQPDMEVIGEASDGETAVQMVIETKPEVVLMDISMPECGGIKALQRIRRDAPDTRVLVLTMYDDPAYLHSGLAAGAAGYLIKRAAAIDLMAAIHAVYQGRTFVDMTLSENILPDTIRKYSSSGKEKGLSVSVLSQQERKVLCLVAQGYMNKEIAERLHLSVKSVETYRARIAEKLGLRSRADLVRYALEVGLLAPGKSAPDE